MSAILDGTRKSRRKNDDEELLELAAMLIPLMGVITKGAQHGTN